MARDTPEMPPGCRLTAAGKIDGRTKEATLLRRVRAELAQHVGGSPTVAQQALIERCAVLRLRLARLDLDLAAGRPVDDVFHLACTNSLSRLLRRLGPAAAAPTPSLADHLAEMARRRGRGKAA